MFVAFSSPVHRLRAAALLAVLTALLVACGGTSSSATPMVGASPTAIPPLKIVTPTPAGAVPPATTAPVAAQPTTTDPAGSTGGYVVQSGDTLYGIAARFGISQAALMQANGIADPAEIHAGQRLLIPARTP